MSSGIGRLRLVVSKRGVSLIESCLGSSGLALGGFELGLGRLDVDTLEFGFGGGVGGLGGSGGGLSLLVLALGGVHVRVGRGIGVSGAFLLIQCVRISRSSSPEVLLRLCQLILQLLQLLLLLLRAACIVGGSDVVVQELLELGDSEISLSVISAVIEYGYLGIGVPSATGCDTDSHRGGIDNVEIVPALVSSFLTVLIFCTVIHIVIVLVDIVRIIAMSHEIFAGLAIHPVLFNPILVINLLLSVETGIGPSESVLSLAAGICAAAAGKIFTVIIVAARVSPDVR